MVSGLSLSWRKSLVHSGRSCPAEDIGAWLALELGKDRVFGRDADHIIWCVGRSRKVWALRPNLLGDRCFHGILGLPVLSSSSFFIFFCLLLLLLRDCELSTFTLLNAFYIKPFLRVMNFIALLWCPQM